MAVVFCWPSPQVRKTLANETNVVFFDERGWWPVCQYSFERVRDPLSIASFSDISDISPQQIRNKLNWWTQIWTRHIGAAEDYEILRAHSALVVLKIIGGLRGYGATSVILPTAIPHHYDSSIVSIACELA